MLSREDRIRLYRAMAYIDSVAVMFTEWIKVDLKIDINEGGKSVIRARVDGTELHLDKKEALILALRLIEGVLEADRVEWLGWRP